MAACQVYNGISNNMTRKFVFHHVFINRHHNVFLDFYEKQKDIEYKM